MGRAYSNDLRERVVRAVIKGGLSRHQAAAQFGVGISTAINWVQRFHETGSVKPDRIGGYRPKKIAGPHREWLMQRCRKDFTVRGLVAELAERGLKVDYRTMWEFVHAEKLSYIARANAEVLRRDGLMWGMPARRPPLPERGLDEALGLSVGFGGIGLGADVLDAQVPASITKVEGFITTAVVGHDMGDGDAEAFVIGHGRLEERYGAFCLLVR